MKRHSILYPSPRIIIPAAQHVTARDRTELQLPASEGTEVSEGLKMREKKMTHLKDDN